MTTTEQHRARVREANLVAATIHGGVNVYKKNCWQCKKQFLTNEIFVNLCSDDCLSDYLYDRGLDWVPEEDPADRWQIDPAGIVNSDTIRVLQQWARKVLAMKLD